MIFIKQITTVEELWNTAGAPTGQIAVDAVVDYVKRVKIIRQLSVQLGDAPAQEHHRECRETPLPQRETHSERRMIHLKLHHDHSWPRLVILPSRHTLSWLRLVILR